MDNIRKLLTISITILLLLQNIAFVGFLSNQDIKIYAEEVQKNDKEVSIVLTAISKKDMFVELSWKISANEVSVGDYEIYRNEVKLETTSDLNYIDNEVDPETTYSYVIKAKDVEGNNIGESNIAEVTIELIEDIEVPAVPQNLEESNSEEAIKTDAQMDNVDIDKKSIEIKQTTPKVTDMTVELSWTMVTLDEDVEYEFEIYRNEEKIGTATDLNYSDNDIQPETTYLYIIKAKDLVGNIIGSSNPIEVTTESIEDSKLPTAPQNLAYKINKDNSVDLSWKEAANNAVIKEYEIYNGTELAYTTSHTHFTVTGLIADTAYVFTVKARDVEDNLSEESNSVEIKLTNLASTKFTKLTVADDGCRSYPYITMEDDNDFAVVKQCTGEIENVKIVGLDYAYSEHGFTSTEKDYITWTSSDSSVVKFYNDYYVEVDSITGKDIAAIKIMGTGTATVTITYDTPDDDPVSVKCYVVVEDPEVTRSVSGVDIKVDGVDSDDFTMTGVTVPLFDLSDKGICSDDRDVLENTPSAIHALLYALEIHYSNETISTDIEDFDFNWVKANVVVGREGSYVGGKPEGDINDDKNDWKFKINSSTSDHAASQIPLSPNDHITWEIKDISGSEVDDGCTTYPYITMADSNDFAVVRQGTGVTEYIKVVGLDSAYAKHGFIDMEKEYLTWETSDDSVVMFKKGRTTTVSKLEHTDQVIIKTMGAGSATITITYDTPDDDPVSVKCYVIVEDSKVTSSVSGVDIKVDGVDPDDFTMTGVTVPLFDLSDKGICDDDSDVLENTPSAIHALLYALEIHYSNETISTDIQNFDFNWVKANVVVGREGSYVGGKPEGDINDDKNDWKFKINSSTSDHAASQIPLSPNDHITWKIKDISGSEVDDGCTTYPYITMADSNDFAVVRQGTGVTEYIKVVGLDSEYAKHGFIDMEKEYLTWETSGDSVVMFKKGRTTTVSKLEHTDQVIIKTMGTGSATITITYDTPDDDPVSVKCYVIVEDSKVTSSVPGVDIKVDGVDSLDFTMTGITVPLFDLSDKGICDDDSDVLKKTPSVIHALLYALEVYYSDETTSTDIEDFDFDWVKSNVIVERGGSYISKIDDDINDDENYWKFEMNLSTPEYFASQIPLAVNDSIIWKIEDASGPVIDDGYNNYPSIVANRLTIVTQDIYDTQYMKVFGSDSPYFSYTTYHLIDWSEQHSLTDSEKKYITWTTSDNSVVRFYNEYQQEVDSIVGKDRVILKMQGQGTAIVTVTYDTPDNDPVTFTCYVVVEGPSLSKANIEIKGRDSDNIMMTDVEVPLFDLSEKGICIDDDDVLKKTSSILHALLYVLEIYHSDETTSTDIRDFDFDWVKANVVLGREGGNVVKIEDDTNDNDNFWGFEVNSSASDYAPSQIALSDNDKIIWEFKGEYIPDLGDSPALIYEYNDKNQLKTIQNKLTKKIIYEFIYDNNGNLLKINQK